MGIPFLFLLFLCCYSEIHCNSYIIFNNEGTCNENFIIGYPADNNCYGSNFTHAGNHYDGLKTYWDTDSCTIATAFYTKAGQHVMILKQTFHSMVILVFLVIGMFKVFLFLTFAIVNLNALVQLKKLYVPCFLKHMTFYMWLIN